jgi:galactonate dehydratase
VKKIAAMAEAYNVSVAPHNCGSALSTAAALQASCCITNFMTLEIYPYFPERPGYVQLLDDPPEARIVRGWLDAPVAPGIGATLSAAARPFLWATLDA